MSYKRALFEASTPRSFRVYQIEKGYLWYRWCFQSGLLGLPAKDLNGMRCFLRAQAATQEFGCSYLKLQAL